MEHKITRIEKDSIAHELEIEAGDTLISLNGQAIGDILDYKEHMAEEKLLVLIKREDSLYEFDVEKFPGEDLGLTFASATMDPVKRCSNQCIFCFIDQLPTGLRPTLYFKDDDYRLSLLHGNYVSLSNLSPGDMKRILNEKISPLYISIHTTNPILRCKMLGNKKAAPILELLQAFKKRDICFHGQIVLCPGINDGEELNRTLQDLANLTPNLLSLSLVPVGITAYRHHLYSLRGFTPEGSRKVIEQAAGWQKIFLQTKGVNLVYVADEFYLSAESLVPPAAAYDDFPQMENGVGMVRLFMDEFEESKDRLPAELPRPHTISIATGVSAEIVLQPVVKHLNKIKNLQVNLIAVENQFFGGGVTVTGLLTGRDLVQSLKSAPLGEELFISAVMLKDGGDLFLDSMRLQDVEEALKTKITPVINISQFIARIVQLGDII